MDLSLKKYNLIILASGEDEPWCQQYGYKKKAFLPLLGKPMLGWVIEAFHRSEYIDNIVVVGPKELDQLNCMRYVRKHLIGGNSFIRNLLSAIFYTKVSIYKFARTHNGYLISFCDAPLLTTPIINATLKNIAESEPGIALHYVQKETITRGGYPVENRSYMHDADKKAYTGSNIYYIKKMSKLFGVLKDITLLRVYRKEPEKILKHTGCENKHIPEIEQILSKKLSTRVKIFVSPYAEMGVDVDKPSDYELAKIHLLQKQKEYRKSRDKKIPDIYTESDDTDAED